MKQQRVADKFSEQMNSKTGYENFFDGVVAMCDNRVIDNELGEQLKVYVSEWLAHNSLAEFDKIGRAHV